MLKKKYIIITIVLLIIVGIFLYINRNQNTMEHNDVLLEGEEQKEILEDLRLGISEFDTINPIISENKEIINISPLIYDPLLTLSNNYELQLCLAKEYSKVNNTSYIVKLNENIKWSDGTEFTADDVKFTIETLKVTSSVYSDNVKDIKDVEVVDKNTIRINLKEEVPFFEYNLIFPIVSKKQYEDKNMKNSKDIPIGTGIYKVEKITDEKIDLTINGQYRNLENNTPTIKKIEIYIYSSMGEVYNDFKLDKLDIVNTSNYNVEEYVGSIGYNKKEYPGREYDYLAFNCEDTILQYKEVRQAISCAINKKEIISNVYNNKYYEANFPLDYGNFLYDNDSENDSYNINMAQEILEEAGWKYEYGSWHKYIDGYDRTIELDLIVLKDNEARTEIANLIKEQLEKLGVTINVYEVSEATYQSYLEQKDYEMILTGVYNSYSPDISTFFGENNLANYSNEKIQTIINELNSISDVNVLKDKYKEIIELVKDEVPYVGICRNKNTVLYSENLMGEITPNNYTIFYNIQNWYREK